MSVQMTLFENGGSRSASLSARLDESVGDRFDVTALAENFDVLAEAFGGPARLRGFVLDLATRGRLVPQVPAEGMARPPRASSAPVAERSADTPMLFDLPHSWCWTTIGSVCSYIQRGKSPRYVETSSIPVVSQKCVQWEGFLIDRARFIDPSSLSAYAAERFLREGDLLWNSTGHGTVGRAAVFRADRRYPRVVADSHVTVLRPQIEPRFLWCWLASPTVQATINDIVSGTTKQTELATSTITSQRVPLPPLAEQKRIVAKVDQLMALCDDLESRQAKKREIGTRLTKSALEALTTAEGPAEFDAAWKRVVGNFSILIDTSEKVPELRGAIRNLALRGALTERGETETTGAAMLERIEAERERRVRAKQARRTDPILAVSGDDVPFPVPKTWAWARLGHLCWKVADGPHFSPKYVEREQGVPFLSGRNIRIEGFELDDMKYVSPADHQAFCQRTKPERGDVLYTKGGTTGVALVNDLDFEFSVWVHVAVLKLDLTNVDPQYVAVALNSPHCYQQSQKYTHGTGNRDLGLTRMVLITLPLPPLEEQKRIVARVAQLMKVCDELEAKLRHAEDRAAKLAEAVVRELVA